MTYVIAALLFCIVLAIPDARDCLITLIGGAIALAVVVAVGGIALLGLVWILAQL